jgi:hypothetical protein
MQQFINNPKGEKAIVFLFLERSISVVILMGNHIKSNLGYT